MTPYVDLMEIEVIVIRRGRRVRRFRPGAGGRPPGGPSSRRCRSLIISAARSPQANGLVAVLVTPRVLHLGGRGVLATPVCEALLSRVVRRARPTAADPECGSSLDDASSVGGYQLEMVLYPRASSVRRSTRLNGRLRSKIIQKAEEPTRRQSTAALLFARRSAEPERLGALSARLSGAEPRAARGAASSPRPGCASPGAGGPPRSTSAVRAKTDQMTQARDSPSVREPLAFAVIERPNDRAHETTSAGIRSDKRSARLGKKWKEQRSISPQRYQRCSRVSSSRLQQPWMQTCRASMVRSNPGIRASSAPPSTTHAPPRRTTSPTRRAARRVAARSASGSCAHASEPLALKGLVTPLPKRPGRPD